MSRKISLKFFRLIILLVIIILTAGFFSACFVYNHVAEKSIIENKIDEVMDNKDYVETKDISKTFLDAVVAVEDHRFYKHGAVDFISIARAILTNIKEGHIVEGGSTITQQLAKNLFLSNDQTVERKIKEIAIAYKLEEIYTKEQILELYVNAIYYGDGFTGIKQACNGYFDKEPDEISYDEATILAGLPQAPSRYALNTNYEQALIRQREVIEALNEW